MAGRQLGGAFGEAAGSDTVRIDAQQAAAKAARAMQDFLQKDELRGVPVAIISKDQLDHLRKEYVEAWESGNGRPIVSEGAKAYGGLIAREKEYFNARIDRLGPVATELGPAERGMLLHQLKSYTTPTQGPATVRLPMTMATRGDADAQGREHYQEAEAAVVLVPASTIPAKEWAAHFLSDYTRSDGARINPGQLGNIPGTPEQWQLFISLHEGSHVSGAGEAQADLMAATQYAQIMGADDGVVQAFADLRAIDAVMRFDHEKQAADYGWATAEKLDLAAELGADFMNEEITPERLHDMRFDELADYSASVTSFTETLKDANPEAFAARDMTGLAAATKQLLDHDAFGKPPDAGPEWHIAERFAEAAERVTGERDYGYRYVNQAEAAQKPETRTASAEAAPSSQL